MCVSVVMATFNGAAHIRAQIESILKQLGPQDELVIADDGSTDDTLAQVQLFTDSRIRLLGVSSRLGYVKNFERAVTAASGAFILFSDQDDVWCDNRLSRSVELLQVKACVCGDAVVTNSNLETILESYWKDRRPLGFDPFSLFVRPAVIGATMACRTEFVRTLTPFPADVPHDLWVSLNAALDGELAITYEPFIHYRRHQYVASLTASNTRRGLRVIAAERMRLLIALVRRRMERH